MGNSTADPQHSRHLQKALADMDTKISDNKRDLYLSLWRDALSIS